MGADEWHDPHDIIPEEFREEFGDSETVADALRRAEGRPSTTPDSERERCPFCGSLSVEQRSPRSHQLQPDLSAWKCRAEGCRRGFDSPADETTIPMTDERANPFEWIGDDEQHDPDDRTGPPLDGSLRTPCGNTQYQHRNTGDYNGFRNAQEPVWYVHTYLFKCRCNNTFADRSNIVIRFSVCRVPNAHGQVYEVYRSIPYCFPMLQPNRIQLEL